MIVIPAIDVIDGACVRLTEGRFDTKKKYSDNPVEVAEEWKRQGAAWLHIIDLDGARKGKLKNLKVVSQIKRKIDIKIQYGGGVRDEESVKKVMEEGADRIILGTGAIEDADFLEGSIVKYKDRVILSLDYGKDGIIFKNGWQSKSGISIFEITGRLDSLGAGQAIITDISRDGTLKGINLDFIKEILKSSGLNFIIAGGIRSLADIANLKKIENMGISGVIIGKALYEKDTKISLKQAIRIGMGNDN
jgi:phosphoribosylformimino-5-aminoimidazole carboxamide ribotide isomerase